MIRALIFDFDGLILDTETPEFEVWQTIYREHGQEFPLEQWGRILGGNGLGDFDPVVHLESLTGRPLDRARLRERHRLESTFRVLLQEVRPGVADYLLKAGVRQLALGVASSSPHAWVDGHLQRLGLLARFQSVICADDVPPGRTKPHPDLFLHALAELDVPARQAIAFEDSPNGVRAAKAAGLFTVAVPNPLTARFDLRGADLILPSLSDLPLDDLLGRFR